MHGLGALAERLRAAYPGRTPRFLLVFLRAIIASMDRLQDARQAMLLARVDLDDYLHNREPNPAEFEKVYEAVRLTTGEYARLMQEHLNERYGTKP